MAIFWPRVGSLAGETYRELVPDKALAPKQPENRIGEKQVS